MLDVAGDTTQELNKAANQAIKLTAQTFSLVIGLLGFILGSFIKKCEENGIEAGKNVEMTLEGKDSIKRLFRSEEEVMELGELFDSKIGKDELGEIKRHFRDYGVHFAFEKIENADDSYRVYFAGRHADNVKAAMKSFVDSHPGPIGKFRDSINMSDEEKANDEDLNYAKDGYRQGSDEAEKSENSQQEKGESMQGAQHENYDNIYDMEPDGAGGNTEQYDEDFSNIQEDAFSSAEEDFYQNYQAANDENIQIENSAHYYELEEAFAGNGDKQYKSYLLAAGKTAKSILISCAARLAAINIPEVGKLLSKDELQLHKLGEVKSVLFVIIPDTDSTYNFIAAIMYTQLFNILCTIADEKYGGPLPVHVRCLLDEFANIGTIPQWEKLIATIRSREISAMMVLQARSQLKAIYKDNDETIIGNCDSEIFLGGKEGSTLKEISEALGKETIDDINLSDSRGQSDSLSVQHSKLGRELMSLSELKTMDRKNCIVQISGLHPFLSDKYDITKHPKYKYHASGGKGDPRWLDVGKYLARRREPRRSELKHIETLKFKDFEVKVDNNPTTGGTGANAVPLPDAKEPAGNLEEINDEEIARLQQLQEQIARDEEQVA